MVSVSVFENLHPQNQSWSCSEKSAVLEQVSGLLSINQTTNFVQDQDQDLS